MSRDGLTAPCFGSNILELGILVISRLGLCTECCCSIHTVMRPRMTLRGHVDIS